MNKLSMTRRAFVTSASAAGLVGVSGLAMPYYSRASQRPAFTHGVQSGDVDATSGMVWTRYCQRQSPKWTPPRSKSA